MQKGGWFLEYTFDHETDSEEVAREPLKEASSEDEALVAASTAWNRALVRPHFGGVSRNLRNPHVVYRVPLNS